MNLADFLIYLAERALKYEEIYLVPGKNGPYNDPETPLRIRGHWLITFSKCYELTGKKIYKDKVINLAEYLVSDDARPYGYSFYHRMKEGKDKCNGLIGQAWTIESLAEASKILEDDKYLQKAKDVFSLHRFHTDTGLWSILDIDGHELYVDPTLNHQLWFAAAGSLVIQDDQDESYSNILQFMNDLSKNITFLSDGLIYHPIESIQEQLNGHEVGYRSTIKRIVKGIIKMITLQNINFEDHSEQKDIIKKKKMIHKSLGYHSFITYAFSLLKMKFPDLPLWKTLEINSSVKYLSTESYKEGLNDNIYGYTYNPPGFEIPFSLAILGNQSKEQLIEVGSKWINEQFRRSYDTKNKLFGLNNNDPVTLTSRIYEITRFPDYMLDQILVEDDYL